jgi:transcriptional regulator with XRE-family HTH domain
MNEKYSVLLDQTRRPVVTRDWLWVFSPAKAADVAQALGRVASRPLESAEVQRLAKRLGVKFVSIAPDHLPPSALTSPNAAYRCYCLWLGPSQWAVFEPPAPPSSVDTDAIALMNAPSSQFTAGPRETAPEEYAASGELLREQRERAGLTQEELARASGVARQTINRIESGHDKPHSRVIRLLAKALGIPYAALLGYEFDEGVKVRSMEFFAPGKVDRMDFYRNDDGEEEEE